VNYGTGQIPPFVKIPPADQSIQKQWIALLKNGGKSGIRTCIQLILKQTFPIQKANEILGTLNVSAIGAVSHGHF
jgi:hypothetical protein